MSNLAPFPEPLQLSNEAPANPRIRIAGRTIADWDVIHRPSTRCKFRGRIRAAVKALEELGRELRRIAAPQKRSAVPLQDHLSALLELRSNYRMLRAAITAISGNPRLIARLPRAVFPPGQTEPRIAAIARVYLNTVDGEFSADTFRAFVEAIQEREPLHVEELWSAATFLQFALLEAAVYEALALVRSTESISAVKLPIFLKSLRSVSHTDWVFLIEPLILFDAHLRADPAEAYSAMEFESRELYRQRIAFTARYCDVTETEVARAVLRLAQEGAQGFSGEPRMRSRLSHIGYYLIDKGFAQLASLVAFHPPLSWRIRRFVRDNAEDFYICGALIVLVAVLGAILFPALPQFGGLPSLAIALLALVPPAGQIAVDFINLCVTALFPPEPLPKLDFSNGIRPDCTTLVAVPSLLLNEQQVSDLVSHLEVRFLANRDPNLYFALLTDLPDSTISSRDQESHPLVELASRLIEELNAKYSSRAGSAFLLLHRHRIFNRREGVWMSWERKRGKLLDLNKLLAGEYDAFPVKAGPVDVLQKVRYVLTLDSDTRLPRGAAARLVGAIAHPLNQAIIDPKLRIVTAGYAILQPRIGISVASIARTRLAAIYSGPSGFDIYTRAISDAYQELFGEGIFTGKGIYEVASFHAVLNHRFPRNALLSHDLIEGSYARAGLVTDVELIDDFPSRLKSYSRRQHRWVRGDWQIAQWMFSRVPDETGHWGPNPISAISRWKIFDNLRRSLVDPALLILFVAGWLGLPGGPLYWTMACIGLLILPAVLQLCFGLGRAIFGERKGHSGEVLSAFRREILVALLRLVFLSYQTALIIDAILRALIRRFVTGERLLEWESSAQAELRFTRNTSVDMSLAVISIAALACSAFLWLAVPQHSVTFWAIPVLLTWGLSYSVAIWLNTPPHQRPRCTRADSEFLLRHALRIWRYFHQFSSSRHSYLIPDNVEEHELCEAPRVSPTNIGLLLNARQAACELGFITVPEVIELTRKSLASIACMAKYHGHLYNWYNTETLQSLNAAPFVSSVDSGNLVASLYALRAGALELERKPLLHARHFSALLSSYQLIRAEGTLPDSLRRVAIPPASANLNTWIEWLPDAERAFTAAESELPADNAEPWWVHETGKRIAALQKLLRNYLPWMLPEYKPLRAALQLSPYERESAFSIREARFFLENLHHRIAQTSAKLSALPALTDSAERLRALLPTAQENLRALLTELHAIGQEAEHLIDETDFSFLVHPGRQILSIGYDTATGEVHEACYDMLASEARMATFLAIARGDLPSRSWSKLAREHAYANGRYLLLSWTGTMFEYLMPGMWMRNYPGTLLTRTDSACVHAQRAFTRSSGIPWGISESGASRKDPAGHYHYQAYGLPAIALSAEATAGPVISPYSTFLALGVDAQNAVRNLRRMESAGWVGPFGFYEASDYSASMRNPAVVREWMAHHQGMSLLAITNLLRDNIVQEWFHSHPLIQATELLLQEMPINNAVLRSRLKEAAPLAAN